MARTNRVTLARRKGMDTNSARLALYNVVVVFRELRLSELLRKSVRELLPTLPPPMITELPNQLLAIVFPDLQVDCQFANRRLHANDRQAGEVGRQLFCEIVVAAVSRAKEAGNQTINAFGLNYDVLVPMTTYERAGQYVEKYLAERSGIAAAFGGSVTNAGIKTTIRSDCEVNFDLEALSDQPQILKAHVNYHFDGQEPPADAPGLHELIADKYQAFFRALAALPN